jgi:lactate dehydrogenase-like 2-hydroxyacid dehydrogenase
MASTKPDVLLMGPYPAWDLEPMSQAYQIHRYWESPNPAAMLDQLAPSLQAMATAGHLGASRELMEQLPALKLIACYGVGVDAIDLAAARQRGIAVTNTPDVLTDDVADMAVGLLLSVLRRLPQGDRYVRAGQWASRGPMPLTQSLRGRRVGIVGLGRIGSAIARRLEPFGCSLAYSARAQKPGVGYPQFDTALALAQACDVLIVAAAGGAGTRHIVNREVLEALGPKGVIINISRGSTIDEASMLSMLQSGALGGAGLDVFNNEPRIDEAFFTLDNVVLQAHHASGTEQTRRAMGQLVRDNLEAFFSGRALLTPVV